MMVLVGFFLAYTAWGREIYAIGGGRHESAGAGVSHARAMVLAFALSAGCASLAGSLAALKSASAAPFAYEPLLLSAVTAALVGGISLYGGRGNVFSLAVGVLTLRLPHLGLLGPRRADLHREPGHRPAAARRARGGVLHREPPGAGVARAAGPRRALAPPAAASPAQTST